MIRNKKRKKTFVENSEYFKWFEENKEKINITSFKITEDKIKIEYKDKEENEDAGN